jgi:hypothetical protein
MANPKIKKHYLWQEYYTKAINFGASPSQASKIANEKWDAQYATKNSNTTKKTTTKKVVTPKPKTEPKPKTVTPAKPKTAPKVRGGGGMRGPINLGGGGGALGKIK